MRTKDGGVIPNGVPSSMDLGGQEHYRKFGLYRGYVKRAIFPDDSENTSGRLEYVVNVLNQDYFGVQDITLGGGIFNSGCRVRQGTESAFFLDNFFEELKGGEIVWVMFIGGNADFPVIIGSDYHPRTPDNVDRPAPSSSDGVHMVYEFNGLEFRIDKEANLTIKHLGIKDHQLATLQAIASPGTPFVPPIVTNPEAILPNPSELKFAGNGDLSINLNDTLFRMDFTKQDAKIEIQLGAGLNLVFDGLSDEVQIATTTGHQVSIQGSALDKFSVTTVTGHSLLIDGLTDKTTISSATGTTATLDGASDKIEAKAAFGDSISVSAVDGIQGSTPSGTSLSMKSGAVELEGTAGKLKLLGGQVAIGGAAAELLDLFDQLLTELNTLLTSMQAETHTGNLGFPSSPPLNLASYTAAQTNIVSIKALLTSIKGGL